jgi:hypothetical protein
MMSFVKVNFVTASVTASSSLVLFME